MFSEVLPIYLAKKTLQGVDLRRGGSILIDRNTKAWLDTRSERAESRVNAITRTDSREKRHLKEVEGKSNIFSFVIWITSVLQLFLEVSL